MTRDEFESRYRLLQEVTRAGGATTHNAIGPAGAVVMVHFLQDDLLERVRSLVTLPDSERPDRIVTLLEVDHLAVLITKFIMDFPDLESWLDETAPIVGGARPAQETTTTAHESESPPVAPSPPSGPDPVGGDEPRGGEFTALFRAAGGDTGAEPAREQGGPGAETGPPKMPDPRQPAESVQGEAPGEFTRMFGALDPSGAPGEPGPPAQEIRPDPPDEVQGLEDRRPQPPPPPSPPPFRPPRVESDPPPATLDRPAARAPVPPRPMRPAPPPLPPDSPGIPEPRYRVPDDRQVPDAGPPDPGGLTARFASPSLDRTPSAGDVAEDPAPWPGPSEESTPGHTLSDDYLERLQAARPPSASQSQPHADSPGPPPAPTAPPTPPEARGPGAYTRVIAGVRPPSSRPPSGSPPSPPVPERGERESEKGDSIVPFLLVIGLIVVLAVGLVVGFVIFSNRAG